MKKPLITIIPGVILLFPLMAFCQCSNSGTKNGSSFTNDNSIGSYAFSSPSNAGLSDGLLSSASATLTLLSANTQYLKATGFGFTIPNSASICGIEVEVEKSATGINLFASVTDNAVRLLKAGIPTGSNYAKPAKWSSSQNYFTYGGVTDLWGTTWTKADINAADFGVAFSAEINGLLSLLPSARIDNIRMTVYFNLVLPVGINNFTAEPGTGHNTDLKWIFDSDGSNRLLNVQRKSGNDEWKTITQFQAGGVTKQSSFHYTDTGCSDQQAWYRIEALSSEGTPTYSPIVNVKWGPGKFSIYPNPASNELFIDHPLNNSAIFCSGTDGRQWKLPIMVKGTEKSKLDIRQLPPGTYVLNVDGNRGIFIKR